MRLPPQSGDSPLEKPATRRLNFDIALLDEDGLLDLRSQIDMRLPTKALKDLNIERELVLQLITVQNLQRDVFQEEGVPANQKAQTANSVAATLSALAKLQGEVYTSERLKEIEQILIDALQTLPTDVAEGFLAVYEAKLVKAGL